MTPKEKAIELLDKYDFVYIQNYTSMFEVKQCALIAVDEILEATATEYQIQYDNGEYSREIGFRYPDFWIEVKKELEKL